MNLVICSFEYGRGLGAEGICTERFVRALAPKCGRISILASKRTKHGLVPENAVLRRISDKPSSWSLASLLSAAFKTYIDPTWIWQRRVGRAQLAGRFSVVYGRALPLGSIMAAERLALKHRLPYGIHFSDPVPGPWCEKQWERDAMLRAVKKVAGNAVFVTFVTKQAMHMQERLLGIPLEKKSFVIPHVANPPRWFAEKPAQGVRFLYTGIFYGRRKPDTLLAAFARFRQENENSEFHFVGADPNELFSASRRLAIQGAVKVFPFSADLTSHYQNSDVLVATDAGDAEPVFLTTKLVEYLSVNRRVLLVSPAISPGAQLIKGMCGSASRADESVAVIYSTMKSIAASAPSTADYQSRFDLMRPYYADALAETFISQAADHLSRHNRSVGFTT